jgi:flagellar L-ring protein precursor FlgH
MRTITLLAATSALLLAGDSLAAQAPAAPPAAPTAAPAAAPPAAVARPVRQSWTSPRRSFAVGDVVTVYVDEYTLASANTANTATDSRRRDLGLDADMAMPGGGGMGASAAIGSRNDADSRQRGEALRQNRFQSEMSVRVVAVDSVTGLLEVKGAKLVNVDRNQQEVTFTGWVRPQDISAQNAVESWRVADAQLVYTATGGLGKPKGGILGRVLGMIWP